MVTNKNTQQISIPGKVCVVIYWRGWGNEHDLWGVFATSASATSAIVSELEKWDMDNSPHWTSSQVKWYHGCPYRFEWKMVEVQG